MIKAQWYYLVLAFVIASPITTFATIVYLQPVELAEQQTTCVVQLRGNNETHEYYGTKIMKKSKERGLM